MIENASRYLPLVRLCFLMLLFPDLAVRWDCHNYHNCFCSLSTTIMSGWLANSYLSVWRLKYLRTLAVLISARYIWGTDVPVRYPRHLVMSSNKHCCYYMLDCLYGVFAQSVTWVGCDSCVVASVDLEPSWGLFMYCHGLATRRVSSVCHSYITWQGLDLAQYFFILTTIPVCYQLPEALLQQLISGTLFPMYSCWLFHPGSWHWHSTFFVAHRAAGSWIWMKASMHWKEFSHLDISSFG